MRTTSKRRRRPAPLPLGPYPVDADGVRWPVRNRFSPTGLSETLIDMADYALVSEYAAFSVQTDRYVACHYEGKRLGLANLLLPEKPGYLVDHRHGDRLDHRRSELRYLTPSENTANRHSSREGRSSRFRGVTLHRKTRRWQAAAKHHGKCYYAGLFATEEQAAAARDRLTQRLWPGVLEILNNPPTQPQPMIRTLSFILDKQTPGAVRYRETDNGGAPLEQRDAVVGTIYLRKSQLTDASAPPARITVTVDTQQAA